MIRRVGIASAIFLAVVSCKKTTDSDGSKVKELYQEYDCDQLPEQIKRWQTAMTSAEQTFSKLIYSLGDSSFQLTEDKQPPRGYAAEAIETFVATQIKKVDCEVRNVKMGQNPAPNYAFSQIVRDAVEKHAGTKEITIINATHYPPEVYGHDKAGCNVDFVRNDKIGTAEAVPDLRERPPLQIPDPALFETRSKKYSVGHWSDCIILQKTHNQHYQGCVKYYKDHLLTIELMRKFNAKCLTPPDPESNDIFVPLAGKNIAVEAQKKGKELFSETVGFLGDKHMKERLKKCCEEVKGKADLKPMQACLEKCTEVTNQIWANSPTDAQRKETFLKTCQQTITSRCVEEGRILTTREANDLYVDPLDGGDPVAAGKKAGRRLYKKLNTFLFRRGDLNFWQHKYCIKNGPGARVRTGDWYHVSWHGSNDCKKATNDLWQIRPEGRGDLSRRDDFQTACVHEIYRLCN